MMDVKIYGIAYECPHCNRRKGCPFYEIDHLSFNDKINWIGKLDNKKKQAIVIHHDHCTKKQSKKKIINIVG